MRLSTMQAINFDISTLASLMNRAFTNYIGGDADFSPVAFYGFFNQAGVDLNLSSVVQRDDRPVGLGLITRQGWTSRLAAMGIVPEMTGQGIGKWFLGQLLYQARARNDRLFVLEVIEQNERGVRLYKSVGFSVAQRLCGYSAQSTPMGAGANLEEVDVFDVAKQLITYGPDDLPWQAAGTTIARIGPPNRAFRLGPAAAVISDPAQEVIMLRTVVVPPEFQRRGHGTKIVQALLSHFADKRWKIPAICPESIGSGFFEKTGFVREELSQFQMEMKLGI